jgi:hypothetical protein
VVVKSGVLPDDGRGTDPAVRIDVDSWSAGSALNGQTEEMLSEACCRVPGGQGRAISVHPAHS